MPPNVISQFLEAACKPIRDVFTPGEGRKE